MQGIKSMHVYSESAWSARPFFAFWFGFEISDQNLFEQGGVSLGCKPAWWMMQGCMGFNGSVDPRVNRLSSLWPIKSCLGRAVRCWSVDVVRHVGGEISSEISPCALRDLPHTYSCTCFYSTKQRWKQARTLPVVNTGESKLFIGIEKA